VAAPLAGPGAARDRRRSGRAAPKPSTAVRAHRGRLRGDARAAALLLRAVADRRVMGARRRGERGRRAPAGMERRRGTAAPRRAGGLRRPAPGHARGGDAARLGPVRRARLPLP
jgi:hypothetical protein